MQFSLAGALVCLALLLLDRLLNGRMIVAYLASLAFGATALFSLPSLGGSSPMIFSIFSLLLIGLTVFVRDAFAKLSAVFSLQPESWAVLLLIIYSVVGAYVLPRIFVGEIVVFTVTRNEAGQGAVEAGLLAPMIGNITQAGYLALGACTYITVSIVLLRRDSMAILKKAAFAWASLVAALGLIDLFGKLTGAGDLLAPIRTANYAMMTDTDHAIAGFYRLSGGFSESSAFGVAVVSSLAFSISYWRFSHDTLAMLLSIVLFVLLILSTSSTAYATAAIASLWLGLSVAFSTLRGQIRTADIILSVAGLVIVVAAIATYLITPAFYDPLVRLIDVTIINKASSDSALERGLWNTQALQGLAESYGLGIGTGSTRTSSWIVAVASHLGVIGAAVMFILVLVTLRGRSRPSTDPEDRAVLAIAAGVRAAALTSLIAASISAPSPDPGPFFFFAIAALAACRRRLTTAPHSTFETPGPIQRAGLRPGIA